MARGAGGARRGRRGRPGHDAARGRAPGHRGGAAGRRPAGVETRCSRRAGRRGRACAARRADAPPPPPPSRPPPAAWTLPGRATGFDYTVRVAPRRLRPGKPFQLDIEIRPGSALAGSWRAGSARAGLTFLHDRRIELRGDFPLDDAGRLSTGLTLPRTGVHQVELALRGGGRELGRASFELCVGADPAGDRAALERVCPGMTGLSRSSSLPGR